MRVRVPVRHARTALVARLRGHCSAHALVQMARLHKLEDAEPGVAPVHAHYVGPVLGLKALVNAPSEPPQPLGPTVIALEPERVKILCSASQAQVSPSAHAVILEPNETNQLL
eukprot:3516545-Rhodomonas_salina.1